MMHHDPAATGPLLSVLRQLYPLSPAAEAYLRDHVTVCTVTKRKLLLKEGAECRYLYFVLQGALRGFTREGQKDITTWISIENEFVGYILGLEEQANAIENIQALEKCQLLCVALVDMESMYERFPESQVLARKILQHHYAQAERRAFIVRLTTAENKYRHFLARHEALSNRIPLKYIASYLGITLETLSRIRKKFASGKASEGASE